ncbi:MAG: hypothetical protein MJ163_03210 [Alphaproteobacteria bacterium]|nr:hypothetical protein [Alphaproteobacteria bacterium]
MKKYFLLGLMIAIAPNICFGAGARYTQLVREKQRKMQELEKCMGSSNGLKIAGLSTIGLTAAGVAGNVAQAKKLDEYESGIESKQKELEKVNKDIAEKEAEIKKAKEAEEVAAAQKKADETIYKTNCLKTGGRINKNGTCICSDQKPSSDKGSCKRIEVVPVNPNITGQELKGVDANNLYAWNSGSTNEGQDSTGPVNNKKLSIDKTETATASDGDKTVKPTNDENNPNMLKNLVERDITAINDTPASLGAKIYVSGYSIYQLPENLRNKISDARQNFIDKCSEPGTLTIETGEEAAYDPLQPDLTEDSILNPTQRYMLAKCVEL